MAFGIQVHTNAGFVDLTAGISFRKVHQSDRVIGTYWEDYTLPISNTDDLSGEVYLFANVKRLVPPEGRLNDIAVALHKDDVYRANANNLPSSVRVRLTGQRNSPSVTDYARITVYALNLG